jgi:hypothetical protein
MMKNMMKMAAAAAFALAAGAQAQESYILQWERRYHLQQSYSECGHPRSAGTATGGF